MTDDFTDGFDVSDVADRMRAARDHQRMHRQVDEHTIKNFINDLDKDQLEALSLIVLQCEVPQNVPFLMGRIKARLEYKFDVCPCNSPHDGIDAVLGDDEPEMSTEELIAKVQPKELTDKEIEEQDFQLKRTMAVYRIEPNPDYKMEGWEEKYETIPQPFRCMDCGKNYVSVQDRLRRPPGLDGCSGCQLKSAHG